MIGISIGKWEGLDGMGDAEMKKLRAPAERAVKRASMHFEGAVKKTLSGKRSGRIYSVGKRGRKHQASAPGEPPASLTGKLRQSITRSDPVWDGWSVSASIGSALPYARRLEFGGVDRRGVRILPRPYFAPTSLREGPAIDKILEESVR